MIHTLLWYPLTAGKQIDAVEKCGPPVDFTIDPQLLCRAASRAGEFLGRWPGHPHRPEKDLSSPEAAALEGAFDEIAQHTHHRPNLLEDDFVLENHQLPLVF